MSLAGCQIKTTDVNVHLQKNLKIFDKLQKGQGDKSIPPRANYG